ncbi:MAG: TIGR02186 family protein [Alphaproteobacteria bacterium]|nr:TIGR02186 family protein [Alphaproteobacteria bacterium]
MKWLLAFLLASLAIPALAEDLVSGLSQDRIQITSNYHGTDMVVFGAIELGESHGAQAAERDVVVVVRGPAANIAVRRKARVVGVWLNRDSIRLYGMPGYYYVASNRPLAAIARAATLARYQLGILTLKPKGESTRLPRKGEPFRLAAIRIREHRGLYAEAPGRVEFLSAELFRVHVPIPASAPRGEYNVNVYLVRDGTVVSAQTTPLFVDQVGLERQLFNFAHDRPLGYGLATAIMAILTGWASSFLFRRQG